MFPENHPGFLHLILAKTLCGSVLGQYIHSWYQYMSEKCISFVVNRTILGLFSTLLLFVVIVPSYSIKKC